MTKVLVLLLLPLSSLADPIFEGYYKISLGPAPIGYFIQRYDLDAKNKTFSSTYYMYTKTADGTTVESLTAKSNSKLEPINYQFTSLDGGKTKVIDALVKNNKMLLKIIANGKTTSKEIPLSKDVFFSTFLGHLMLKNPKGISVGNKFTYDAVAEEDGIVEKGETFVKEQVKEKGLDCYRTLHTFKREPFVEWINIRGETVKTNVPSANITAELMADPKEAYKGMDFNQSTIKLLFGNIPEGKTNMLSKK